MNLMKSIGGGFGLTIGGGLVYALFTSEMARLVIFGLFLFILGASIVGGIVLLVNRQWTQALGMRRPPNTTNRYQVMPPSYQQPSENWYNVEDSLPQIEQGNDKISNDDPVA